MYYIFAQLTNCNVLGKLPIGDPNNRDIGNCCWWIWQKYINTIHTWRWRTVIMNKRWLTDNEIYCDSNEFHSHLPFDKLWSHQPSFDRTWSTLIIYRTQINTVTITHNNLLLYLFYLHTKFEYKFKKYTNVFDHKTSTILGSWKEFPLINRSLYSIYCN